MRTNDCLYKYLPHLRSHICNSAEPKELATSKASRLITNLLAKIERIAAKRIEIESSVLPKSLLPLFHVHEIVIMLTFGHMGAMWARKGLTLRQIDILWSIVAPYSDAAEYETKSWQKDQNQDSLQGHYFYIWLLDVVIVRYQFFVLLFLTQGFALDDDCIFDPYLRYACFHLFLKVPILIHFVLSNYLL